MWVLGFGFRVPGFRIRDSGSGIWISGFGFWDSGFGFWDSGFVIRVLGCEFQVSGFGIRDSGFDLEGGVARLVLVDRCLREVAVCEEPVLGLRVSSPSQPTRELISRDNRIGAWLCLNKEVSN